VDDNMTMHDFTVLDSLADGILVIDKGYTVIFANTAGGTLFGLPAEDIVGRKCYAFSHNRSLPCDKDCLEDSLCSYKEVFATGLPLTQKHHHTLPDGTKKIFDITASPIMDEHGRPVRIIQVLKDVTELEQCREKFQENLSELETIFNNAPFSMVYLDTELRTLRLNPAMESVGGVSFQEARGKHCYDLWGQYAADFTKQGEEKCCNGCKVRFVMKTGNSQSFERRVGDRFIEVLTTPVWDTNGRIKGALEIGTDRTEQRRAEAILRESESRYKVLFEASPVPLAVADFSAIKKHLDKISVKEKDVQSFLYHPERVAVYLKLLKIIDVNNAVVRLFELQAKKELWNRLASILQSIPDHEFPEGLVALAEGEKTFSHEIRAQTTTGKEKTIIFGWIVEPGYEHSFERVLLSLVDITERRKAEQMLRKLALHLGETEEKERHRLSRELHDNVGQKLTALGINLHILKNNSLLEGEEDIQLRLSDSHELVEDITEQIRSVMADLRPPVLDDYGLLASFNWLAEKVSALSALKIVIKGIDPEPRLSSSCETTLFRIAQEALTNVIKHGHATEVIFLLRPENHKVSLEVTDNGCGFEPSTIKEGPVPTWGILGMKERAEALGGNFLIRTQPDKGTTVVVTIPL